MTDPQPPRIDPNKLDWSEFHDMVHPIFSRYCWRQAGGPWLHIKYWWEWYLDEWLGWHILRHTTCRLGWHSWRKAWRFTGRDDDAILLWSCEDCMLEKPRYADHP